MFYVKKRTFPEKFHEEKTSNLSDFLDFFEMCMAIGDKFHGDQPTGRKGILEKMPVIQV